MLGQSILDLWNKLQKTTFPGILFLVARNEQMEKYPWVSEDDPTLELIISKPSKRAIK